MNIDQLIYFVTIVEKKSFSLAAFELYVSQSTISKQIKSLENELDLLLFERRNSRVFLTPEGKIFFRFAKNILAEHSDMKETLEPYQLSNKGTIRIGSIPILSTYGLTNIISDFTSKFRNSHTKLYFDILEENQRHIVNKLMEGKINLAFVRTDQLLQINSYDSLPFVMDELVVICHKNFPLAKKQVVTINELEDHQLVLIAKGSALYETISEAFKNNNLKLNVKCVTTRHKILLQMLMHKKSASILPKKLLNKKEYPELVTIPFTKPIKSTVALIKLKSVHLNKIENLFWNYFKKNHSNSME